MTQPPDLRTAAGVVRVTAGVAVNADRVWERIGGFAEAGMFLNVECSLSSGDGGLGSERMIGDSIVEKMVAQGRQFYAYAQTQGPMAALGYHGCVAVEDDGPDQSVIVYTLVYDEPSMPAEERAGHRERLTGRFGGAVQAMARYARSG